MSSGSVGSEGPARPTPPVPFFLLNALEVVDVGEGGSVCSSRVNPWLERAGDLGIQAAAVALADCVLSYAVTQLVTGRSFPVTLGLRLDYWRDPPGVGAELTGYGRLEANVGDALLVRGRVEGLDGVQASATLRSVLATSRRRGELASPARSSSALVEVVPLPVDPWPAAAAATASVETVLSLAASHLCGLRLLRAGDGIVELAGRAGAQLERTEGVVHGGAVPVLGQLAGAAALAAAFPDMPAPRRLDTNTEFLRPTLVEAPIALRARVVHRSRRVVTTHAEIFNEAGKPTARVYETAMLSSD